mgnify:CR=1 FL=1
MPAELISANHAAALAATLAARANRNGRGFCSGVYPITPSTECMEYLCLQEIEKGRVVRAESEHSAMGICIGASAAGARAFTATSSNGLACGESRTRRAMPACSGATSARRIRSGLRCAISTSTAWW